MKYEVTTTPRTDGQIDIVLRDVPDFCDPLARPSEIARWVINTRDNQIRSALTALGWTPPGEKAEIGALDVPVHPGVVNTRYRRVTASDVLWLEKELERCKVVLNLPSHPGGPPRSITVQGVLAMERRLEVAEDKAQQLDHLRSEVRKLMKENQ